MSKVVRLAQLLAIKYGFQSRAATVPVNEERIIAEVKRDIRDAYRNYFSREARDSMFQYAADLGEPKSTELIKKMNNLIIDIDKLKPQKLMNSLNHILGLLYQMKEDPERTVRNAIHDSVPAGSEAQRNTRQRLLSKYERSISRAFPTLQKIALRLQLIVPDVAVHGGEVERQRSELSKQQLFDFIMATPAFKQYGIDSFDVLQPVLDDPDLRAPLTKLINAVRRGLVPLNGPQLMEFARRLKQRLEQEQQTNLPALEQPELPTTSDDEKEEE